MNRFFTQNLKRTLFFPCNSTRANNGELYDPKRHELHKMTKLHKTVFPELFIWKTMHLLVFERISLKPPDTEVRLLPKYLERRGCPA